MPIHSVVHTLLLQPVDYPPTQSPDQTTTKPVCNPDSSHVTVEVVAATMFYGSHYTDSHDDNDWDYYNDSYYDNDDYDGSDDVHRYSRA